MKKIILSEKQILTTIRLSGVQKSVLAKIVAAATPEVAYEQISDGRNFVAARDIMKKLGLIDFSEGTASLTDTGTNVMKDENLMDEGGELTSDGQQYVEAEGAGDIKKPQAGMADADASTDPMADPEQDPMGDDLGLGGEDDTEGDPTKNPFESTQLIHRINKSIHIFESMGFTPQDIRLMKSGEELPEELFDKIYNFVEEYDPTWMPYGTKKAREGDPINWIMDHLPEIVGIIDKSATEQGNNIV